MFEHTPIEYGSLHRHPAASPARGAHGGLAVGQTMTKETDMFRKTYLAMLMAMMLLLAAGAAHARSAAGLPELAELADKAGRSVVNISTSKTVKTPEMPHGFRNMPPGQGGPFEDFFDQFEKFFGQPRGGPRTQQSLGSGFIISEDGYIVTNNHVISGADEVEVILQGEDEPYTAEVKGRDPETDLALIKIDVDKKLPVLEFADSDSARVGEWVLAIGNPFGLDHTVTTGIISAKGRVIGQGPYDDFIQTDASINPGNSGGPLLDMDGKVIGINTAIIATGQGIGFAVPSNIAKDVIAQLREYKKVKRGWLGVSIQDIDGNTAKALGMDEPKGALVAGVTDGDPAAKAGVRTGDVVTAVDGEKVEDAGDLTRLIAQYEPGSTIELTVLRKGKERELKVTLGERDLDKVASMGGRSPEEQEAAQEAALGLTVRPVMENEAKALGLKKPEGLLVTEVEAGSVAENGGVRPGDVLLEANQHELKNSGDLEKIVRDEGKEKGVIMLLIAREGRNFFKTLVLDD